MRRSIALVTLVMATACGGSDSAQTTPTVPTVVTPTPASLAISGATGFRTGQSRTFSVDVTLSNGTTQPAASPTWTSTDPAVASVSSTGFVTAIAHGTVSISVAAQGLTAQVPIQVWQDYQGTWSGTYIVRVCRNTGWFADRPSWCSTFPPGSSLPFQLTLTQTNGAASGTLQLGTLTGPISGGVFDDRRFVGTGTPRVLINGVTFSSNVGTFSVLASGNSLTGNLVVDTTAVGFSGNGYWEAALGTVTKSLTVGSLDAADFDAALRLRTE